jgi:hypothetical protein
MTDNKMYYVKTVVSEYDAHNKNVLFAWFKTEDERFFRDLDDLDKELFTEAEAKMLGGYLDVKYSREGVTTICEAQSVDAAPVGKRVFCQLYPGMPNHDYPLSFKVQAYFDYVYPWDDEKDKGQVLRRACALGDEDISKFTLHDLHRAIEDTRRLKKLCTKELGKRAWAQHDEDARKMLKSEESARERAGRAIAMDVSSEVRWRDHDTKVGDVLEFVAVDESGKFGFLRPRGERR